MPETIAAEYGNDAPAREVYIQKRIQAQIDYYEAKSTRNKKTYYALSVAAILANALIPVVSAFLPSATLPKLIITSLSSCAAVISSVLVLFNAKDLWTKYRHNASRLTALLHQYYAGTGVFAALDKDQAFHLLTRLSEQEMEEENKRWESMFEHDAPPAQRP